MASLTKMMTMTVALEIAREREIDLNSTLVEVSPFSACVGGSSAFLRGGDRLMLIDLFYAMNLPSGRDAN